LIGKAALKVIDGNMNHSSPCFGETEYNDETMNYKILISLVLNFALLSETSFLARPKCMLFRQAAKVLLIT
jgi:hypothetical protein